MKRGPSRVCRKRSSQKRKGGGLGKTSVFYVSGKVLKNDSTTGGVAAGQPPLGAIHLTHEKVRRVSFFLLYQPRPLRGASTREKKKSDG